MKNKFILVLYGVAIVCSVLFSLTGCKKPIVISKTSLGIIVDANVISTSFNESQKTCIKTEKAVIIVREIVSVDIGKEAWSIEWSNGRRTFEWEGARYTYPY